MNKIVLLTVCFFIAIVCVAAQTVELSFVGDKVIYGTPVVLQIKTNNASLASGITFSPQLSPGSVDDPRPVPASTWQIGSLSSSNAIASFGFNRYNYILCKDQTGASNFKVEYQSGKWAVSALDTAVYNTVYSPSNWGSFTITCPVVLYSHIYPEDTNFAITYLNNTDGSTAAINQKLDLQTKVITTPQITFDAVSVSFANAKSPIAGGMATVSFTTDTRGTYDIGFDGGVYPDYMDRSTLQPANFWCSSNSNGFKPRMAIGEGSLSVFVDQDTNGSKKITCTFPISFGGNTEYFSTQSVATVALQTYVVKKSFALPSVPGLVKVSSTNHSPSTRSTLVEIELSNLIDSSTPLVHNSTVEFKFTGIDVTSLQLPIDPAQYRHFECGDYRGDIEIVGSSTIRLTSVVPNESTPSQIRSTMYCAFNFFSPVNFFNEAVRARVVVTINGAELYNIASQSSGADIFNSNPVLVVEDTYNALPQVGLQDGATSTQIYGFSVRDAREANPTKTLSPMVALAFSSTLQNVNMDDYAKQLTCTTATPSSTIKQNLPLTFDAATFVWFADLSSLRTVNRFDVDIVCTRSIVESYKNNVNLRNPNLLNIAVFDKITATTFIRAFTTSISEDTPPQLHAQDLPDTATTEYTVSVLLQLVQDFKVTSGDASRSNPLDGRVRSTSQFAAAIDAVSAALGNFVKDFNTTATFSPLTAATGRIVSASRARLNNMVKFTDADEYHKLLYSTDGIRYSARASYTSDTRDIPYNRGPSVYRDLVGYIAQATSEVNVLFKINRDTYDAIVYSGTSAGTNVTAVLRAKELYQGGFAKVDGQLTPTFLFGSVSFSDAQRVSPIDAGCGFKNAYAYRYGETVPYDPIEHRVQCPINTQCTVNGDCIDGTVCTGGTCKLIFPDFPKYSSEYAIYDDAANLRSKYYSAAPTMTMSCVVVGMVAIVASIMTILF